MSAPIESPLTYSIGTWSGLSKQPKSWQLPFGGCTWWPLPLAYQGTQSTMVMRSRISVPISAVVSSWESHWILPALVTSSVKWRRYLSKGRKWPGCLIIHFCSLLDLLSLRYLRLCPGPRITGPWLPVYNVANSSLGKQFIRQEVHVSLLLVAFWVTVSGITWTTPSGNFPPLIT